MLNLWTDTVRTYHMCSILTCRKNKKNKIFVDLNRAGHDKSVEKKLAFSHKYLQSYGRFTNNIIT